MANSRLLSWLAALAIFIGTHCAYHVEYHPERSLHEDGVESLQLANSIAFHGTFSDPFMVMKTGLSAHTAPAFPALVAVVIHFYGNGAKGRMILDRLSVFVVAMLLSLLPLLTRHLGLGFFSGALAAAAWLLGPIPFDNHSEADIAALLAVLLTFPMVSAFRRPLRRAELVATGVLWGLLLLFNPVPIMVLLVWLTSLYFFTTRSRIHLAVLVILPILVILPWCVRNYLVFGEPIFLRDNLGLELAVSNNSCAHYSFYLNDHSKCFSLNHPNVNRDQAQRLLLVGEAQYNRTRMRDALGWIQKIPVASFNFLASARSYFGFPL